MNHLLAIRAAFRQQWKIAASSTDVSFLVLTPVPTAAVFAWIVGQSADPSALSYIYFGAPVMMIYQFVVFMVGWSLNNELVGRTLEFSLISRTPMMFVMFGKAVATIVRGIPGGIVTAAVIFIVSRQSPEVADPGPLVVSLLFVFIGMSVTALAFSPLMVIAGGRGGFFNAFIPFGVVLSGFLFPVAQLPTALRLMARLIPTSWAMEGVWQSIQGVESVGSLAGVLAMSLLASAALLGVTWLMFGAVEKRIRVTGTLGIY